MYWIIKKVDMQIFKLLSLIRKLVDGIKKIYPDVDDDWLGCFL